jgi:hypothetical protein
MRPPVGGFAVQKTTFASLLESRPMHYFVSLFRWVHSPVFLTGGVPPRPLPLEQRALQSRSERLIAVVNWSRSQCEDRCGKKDSSEIGSSSC